MTGGTHPLQACRRGVRGMQRCRFDHANRAHEPPLRRHRGASSRWATPPPSRSAASRTTAGGSCPATCSAASPARSATGTRHAAEAVERGRGRAPVRALHPRADRAVDVVQTRVRRGRCARSWPGGRRLLRYPARDLLMVGVTGTNGKTTVTQLLGDLLGATGRAHQRHGHAVGDADDARGDGGAASAGRGAGPPEVRRGPPRGGHGGLEPRAGAVPRGGHPLRRGRLHQPEPRPPRLPRTMEDYFEAKAMLFTSGTPCAAWSMPTIPGAAGCWSRSRIPTVARAPCRRHRRGAAPGHTEFTWRGHGSSPR